LRINRGYTAASPEPALHGLSETALALNSLLDGELATAEPKKTALPPPTRRRTDATDPLNTARRT
jgi:hypothetical protein